MTRIWAAGEPVEVAINRHGDPTQLVWRGRHHRVEHIEQRWQTDADWWDDAGRIWRDYWAVLTDDGLLLVLFHDLLAGDWFVTRLYD